MRLVCLNEFKLKRGFHQVFGTTAFGCLHQARMTRAYELLRAGQPVTRAAAEVGYTNVSHFGAAYRKRFGVLPSAMKSTR